MARSPKKGTSGPTEAVATTLLLPPEKVVRDLVRDGRNAKIQTQSIAGEYGVKVAAAVENKHLDRKALSIARGLDALSDEKLHVTYVHLMEYVEWLGIKKRALAQEEMFENRKDDDDDGKVAPIGDAARRVSETAGNA